MFLRSLGKWTNGMDTASLNAICVVINLYTLA